MKGPGPFEIEGEIEAPKVLLPYFSKLFFNQTL